MISELSSVCGHKGTKVVQYSGTDTGYLHTVCTPCFNAKIYYVQEVVVEEQWDIKVENWVRIEV